MLVVCNKTVFKQRCCQTLFRLKTPLFAVAAFWNCCRKKRGEKSCRTLLLPRCAPHGDCAPHVQNGHAPALTAPLPAQQLGACRSPVAPPGGSRSCEGWVRARAASPAREFLRILPRSVILALVRALGAAPLLCCLLIGGGASKLQRAIQGGVLTSDSPVHRPACQNCCLMVRAGAVWKWPLPDVCIRSQVEKREQSLTGDSPPQPCWAGCREQAGCAVEMGCSWRSLAAC